MNTFVRSAKQERGNTIPSKKSRRFLRGSFASLKMRMIGADVALS